MSSTTKPSGSARSIRVKNRIMLDIKDVASNQEVLEQAGIYCLIDEEDIYHCSVMLIGSEGTPYAHGYYFFSFTFPENYPMSPPKGVSMTQTRLTRTSGDFVAMRFNPNLYTCGKLCLSILGTWDGPSWLPTMTLSIVCNAIQALVLHDAPLKNEPAYYDVDKSDPRVVNYSKIVAFANYRSIVEMLEQRPTHAFDPFLPKMQELFLANFDKIMAGIEREKSTTPATLRDETYGMDTIIINYDDVARRMIVMRDRLLAAAPAPAPEATS